MSKNSKVPPRKSFWIDPEADFTIVLNRVDKSLWYPFWISGNTCRSDEFTLLIVVGFCSGFSNIRCKLTSNISLLD